MSDEAAKDSAPVPESPASVAKSWLQGSLERIELHTERDILSLQGPIAHGLDLRARVALEGLSDRRPGLLVILDTPGGVVEIVERIAALIRAHYSDVQFLVVDRAMSAGTVLVMSGDEILMDYYSCLGPIDPQVERDNRLVPALSYLEQYRRLIERAEKDQLTTAELVLLKQFDLAELDQFQLAATLSVKLIEEWLSKYKFKDWTETETNGHQVDDTMRRERGREIAEALNDQSRWYTHTRGIHIDTLRSSLNLKVKDYSEDGVLKDLVWNYFWFLRNYMENNQIGSFVHSRAFM